MLNKKNENEINAIAAEIVEEARKLLKGNIYKILLYGSCARGDYGSESDIDIMIIVNCKREEACRYRKQVSKIAIFHCMRSVIALEGIEKAFELMCRQH